MTDHIVQTSHSGCQAFLVFPHPVSGQKDVYKRQVVGYALLVFYWSCEAGGQTVQLEELYLSERVRGCGLGSQFMEWLLREYEGSAKRFRLEVCPRNQRVKKLYEHYGFEILPYEQMVLEKN